MFTYEKSGDKDRIEFKRIIFEHVLVTYKLTREWILLVTLKQKRYIRFRV